MTSDMIQVAENAAVVLQIVAVVLAYRLTRITGGFRAWWLMIVAFTLQVARRFGALALALGPAWIASAFQAADSIIALAISCIMLIALYDLNVTFDRVSKGREKSP
jgi:hypothetical protein